MSDPNVWTPLAESRWLTGHSIKNLSKLNRKPKQEGFLVGMGAGPPKSRAFLRLNLPKMNDRHATREAKVIQREVGLRGDGIDVNVRYSNGKRESWTVPLDN